MATDFQPLIDAVKTHEGINGAGGALISVLLCALAACGTSTVSEGVNDEGSASRIVFPDAQSRSSMPAGTWPLIEELRQVASGADKDHLRTLLGRPHFAEGMYDVREWDYIFNFRGSPEAMSCQYKVIFDKHGQARSFHWMPAECGAWVRGQGQLQVEALPEAETRPTRLATVTHSPLAPLPAASSAEQRMQPNDGVRP